MWYYAQNNQQMGPVSEEELQSKLRGGILVGTTLAWKEGMSDWKPVSEIAELASALMSAGPSVSEHVPASGMARPPQPDPNPYSPPISQIGGSYAPQVPTGPPINNGGILAFAIAVTLLCCIPFGIVGIVFAVQISSRQAVGDYLGAQESARKAMFWNWLGFGIGLGLILLSAISAMIR